MRDVLASLLFAVALALPGHWARAQTSTWSGAGGDNHWTDGFNWGLLPPLNLGTASVHFGGSTRLTPDMDANWNILSLTFNSGAGAFTLGSTGSFTLTIQGSGITNNSTSTETINNAITLGAGQTWSATSGNLTFGGNLNNNNQNLIITGADNTTISGIISGNGTLTKNGAGTLTLSGANTYAGVTTVSAGILNIQNNTALGTTGAGTTVSSGATLQLQNSITVGAEALTISGTGASGQNGALVNAGGTNNYGGLLTLGAASTISSDSGTLNLTNAGTITGSGFGLTLTGSGNGSIASIIGTGGGTLTKSGSGTWTLTGANTYTGGTNINSGALNIQSNNALGGASGVTTVSSGAQLQVQGGLSTSEPITIDGSGLASDGAIRNISGNNTISGNITLQSSSSIGSDAGNLNLSGVVSGNNFGMTKVGAGTVTLSGASTYSGATTVNAGTLALGSAGSISNTSHVTVNSGGTLLMNGNNNINNSNANATLNGGAIAVGASNNSQTVGTLTLSATSTIDFSTFTNNTLRFANSSGIAWSGTLNIYDYTQADALYFGNSNSGLTSGQLGQVAFYAGAGTGFLGDGIINSVGRVSPIPEPSWVLAGLGLLSLAAYRERRRFMRWRPSAR